MSLHRVGIICPYCEERARTESHPLLYSVWRLVKAKFQDCHISEVWRGEAAQNEDVRTGKSEKRWPLSQHNAMANGKPCSRAMDLFRLVDGKAVFEREPCKEISLYLKSLNKPIHWGGDWVTFLDNPHFELDHMIPQNWPSS